MLCFLQAITIERKAMNNLLHCIIKKEGAYWSARCLDFTLYAVGETQEEAKIKLSTEINSYLYESTDGLDKKYTAHLLKRRAPLQDWVVYYAVSFLHNYRAISRWLGYTFQTPTPHRPYHSA